MAAKTKKDESCTGATDSKEKEQQAEVQNTEPEENSEEVKPEEAASEEKKPEGEELFEEEGTPEKPSEESPEESSEESSEEHEETPEEMEDEKQVLVAVYPILYESHQYKVGDKLPASNAEMVEAWTEAGTAKFMADKPKRTLKATPASAQAGVEGLEGTSTSGKLLGRV